MKPTECVAAFLFIGTMAMLTTAMKEDSSDLLSESRFKDLQDYNRLKELQALRSSILLGRLLGDLEQRMEPMQKRDCYFNAGLSHSCDNEDVFSALAEARHLGSFNSPGRRRRRKRQPTMESSNDEDKETTSTEQYATRERKNNKGDENKSKNLRFLSSQARLQE